MADYIPFVNNDTDYQLARDYYADASAVRVLLPAPRPDPEDRRLKQMRLWIDAGIDGYHCLLSKTRVFDSWKTYIRRFDENGLLADATQVNKPSYAKIKRFVASVLNYCAEFQPPWLTVPQLPVVEGTSRNQVNRLLAQATGEWRTERSFTGRLILPLIFTHQSQLKGRTQWRNTVETAVKCYLHAGAGAFWTADSDLDDQKCRSAFNTRFEALVAFHEDLRACQPSASVICGPYWGMNTVLWARGLCDHPAISMGTGYRYMITGAFAMKAKRFHVTLPPLRRWAIASPELRTWLTDAVNALSPGDSARKEFERLRQDVESRLKNKDAAKEQVARSYQRWFAGIQSIPPAGRTLALYQDLSSAYVLGKQLPKLPKSEAPGREAGKVAEQLMLHCL